MFGFFRFLKELFNGTYFDRGVDASQHPGAFGRDRTIDSGTSSSNAMSDSQVERAISNNQESNMSGFKKFFSQLGQLLPALVNRITAGELTGAEREQNQFNSEQAAIDRQFQQDMSNTAYQRSVADMRAAGVNPALAMQQGGASTPSGSTASGSGAGLGASMGELINLLMLKPQIRLMEKQGTAALENARANRESAAAAGVTAEANKDNAETRKFEAVTGRMLADNTIRLGDNTIRFTDAQIESISQSIKESESRIDLQDIERACKEFHLQYDKDTAETNKELLIQQIVYRAVEMSNIQQMSKESMQRVSLMSAEEAGIAWQKEHPKLANAIGIGSGITGVIGNVFKGSVSGVLGKWSKYVGK